MKSPILNGNFPIRIERSAFDIYTQNGMGIPEAEKSNTVRCPAPLPSHTPTAIAGSAARKIEYSNKRGVNVMVLTLRGATPVVDIHLCSMTVSIATCP